MWLSGGSDAGGGDADTGAPAAPLTVGVGATATTSDREFVDCAWRGAAAGSTKRTANTRAVAAATAATGHHPKPRRVERPDNRRSGSAAIAPASIVPESMIRVGGVGCTVAGALTRWTGVALVAGIAPTAAQTDGRGASVGSTWRGPLTVTARGRLARTPRGGRVASGPRTGLSLRTPRPAVPWRHSRHFFVPVGQQLRQLNRSHPEQCRSGAPLAPGRFPGPTSKLDPHCSQKSTVEPWRSAGSAAVIDCAALESAAGPAGSAGQTRGSR